MTRRSEYSGHRRMEKRNKRLHHMKIFIKTPTEIESMRKGGRILGFILNSLAAFIKPGITTADIALRADELFKQYNVKPSFLGYKGYPSSICAAVNEEVVHAIPGKRILREGDVISIDAGVYFEGLHTDSAITICVAGASGTISENTKRFILAGKEALHKAISLARPGLKLAKISKIIEQTLLKHGCRPVRELTGHGIGKSLHEAPLVLNHVDKKQPEVILREGMTLAIEPIYSMGSGKIKTLKDNWTIVTADNSLAAQVEHTIVIISNGCEILTQNHLQST